MLYTTLGTYINSFFNFNLNTNSKITTRILKNSNEILSTLIHEYLHYIQDVSTVYGLINIDQTFSRIMHFYHISEINIELPYFNIKTTDKIFEDNITMFECYENPSDYFTIPKYESDGIKISIKIIEESVPKDFFDSGKYIGVKHYSVKYKKGGYNIKIPFGAQAIQECMARILENKIYLNTSTGTYNIPYDLPEIIILKKYPRLASNKDFIFAICDASLMYYNPAECFIHILNKMKEKRFSPHSVSDVYNFVYNTISFENTSLKKIYEKAISKAKESIKKVVIPGFENARDWLHKTIDYYYDKRDKNISFLSNILSENPSNTRNNFYYLVINNMSPLFYNNSYDFQIVTNKFLPTNGKDDLMYWYYMERMYNYVFIQKNRICPYKEFCNYHNSNLCIYDNNPLRKTNTNCLFDQYKKVFNLQSRNVIN